MRLAGGDGTPSRYDEDDTLELDRRTVAFHEATYPDASLHVWLTERTTDTCFPVDWLGYPHHGSEGLAFADEFDSATNPGRLQVFHGRVMF